MGSTVGIPDGCKSEVAENPRATIEWEMLGNTDVRMFDYADRDLGDLHIGAEDCSYYCMPGPPDRVAAAIYNDWATKSY